MTDVREMASSIAVAKIDEQLAQFASMPNDTLVDVTTIHAALNAINAVWTEDDGQELRDMLRAKIHWFNRDKRSPNLAYRVGIVRCEFETLVAAVGAIEPDAITPRCRFSTPVAAMTVYMRTLKTHLVRKAAPRYLTRH